MVKFTVEVPENVHEALLLLSHAFDLSLDDLVASMVDSDIRGSLSDNLADYCEPLAKKVQEILDKKSPTPLFQ